MTMNERLTGYGEYKLTMLLRKWFLHIIKYLLQHLQLKLRSIVLAWKIQTGRFTSDEPEFRWIEEIIHPGDIVLDIGANFGVYTLKFSNLVGPGGRVIAWEPVPESFYLLTINTSLCRFKNVTLLNLAASDEIRIASMIIPERKEDGLRNYYRASLIDINAADRNGTQVLCCPLDSLQLPARIRLVKIDVEGHEAMVLAGMKGIIERDKPVLIIESISPEICTWLYSQGYRQTKFPGSPNTVFECPGV